MWRRERGEAEVLRVGRHTIERWTSVDGSLSLVATQVFAEGMVLQLQALAGALGALYPLSAKGSVTVVVESAWLPVMHLDTGPALLRASQVEALVRHRFGMYEWNHSDPVLQWELRIDHRAGSRHALAYGLSPALKQTIVTTAKSLGLELAGLTPALAWGWDRLRPDKAWSSPAGWWLWPEQDRTLVARIASGETLCLNAGAATAETDTEVLRLVEAECARSGLDATPEPIAAARWKVGQAPLVRSDAAPVRWLDVRGRLLTTAERALASRIAG